MQNPRQSDQLTRTFTMSGATRAKKFSRDSKTHSSRLTDSKKSLGSKKVIRKKLPSAEVVSRSFTLGNISFLMRIARVAFDHLVPRNVSVFFQRHLSRMIDPPWRETM
ncbi:hypothetical protein [Bradyrhizobium sp. CCBAU 53338]|uniref:hypothetical protein n=1 Tax=Bradyrhizobium sp. CCBAU 53338 TaxID=1325111 RepID=UPI00188BB40B|nr:hypothetical protein [Bradyrhizobium sp. CCBAU 53338]